MSIAYPCGKCGKRYSVNEGFAGKRARCPACGHVTVVPTASVPRPQAIPVPDAYGLAEEPPQPRQGGADVDEPASPSRWEAAAAWWKSANRKKKRSKQVTLLGLSGPALWLLPGIALLLLMPALSTHRMALYSGMALVGFSALMLIEGGWSARSILGSEDVLTYVLLALVPGYPILYLFFRSDRVEMRGLIVALLISTPTLMAGLTLLGNAARPIEDTAEAPPDEAPPVRVAPGTPAGRVVPF